MITTLLQSHSTPHPRPLLISLPSSFHPLFHFPPLCFLDLCLCCLPASYSLLYHQFALRPNPSGSGTGCICMLSVTATCSIQSRREEGELCRALNDNQPSALMWICLVKGCISSYCTAESKPGLTDSSSK